MKTLRLKPLLTAALCSVVLFAFPAFHASAQQISYYTFDAPGTNPSQYSYACGNTDINGPSSPPPVFCLNYQGSTQDPTFIEDPLIADPNYSGGQWVTQMTSAVGSQATSMWFSVPQYVDQGFNVWFQFKITPNSGSGNTADGLAFVIQNSQGGGSVSIPSPNPDNNVPPPGPNTCAETGSGWTAVGGAGGCLGYGGIDNSVALEFDTFNNYWDPTDIPDSGNDNHIALQSCGTTDEGYSGLPNSPVHSATNGDTSCLVTLGTTSTLISNPTTSAIAGSPGRPVTLADGNLHQVVIVYNGPEDNPANTLTVYLDPAFNPGTVTPVTGSVPLFQGPFDITQYISLCCSDTGVNPAYVGFTSATGGAFEQHEVSGWTFTPHTQVQQTQTLNSSPTSPSTTTFSFGTHNYSVTYPPDTVPAGTLMTVIATPIPQATFDALIAATPFTGAMCQIYDDTGNNCIAYNVSCTDSSYNPIACPVPSGAASDCAANPTNPNCITLNTEYNNSTQPTTPGFLQGDPFYAPVSSINSSGTSGSIFCLGECAVVTGQTVNIANPDGTLVGTVTVGTVDSTYQFEFTSTTTIPSDSGGVFLTSVNVQNIFTSYSDSSLDGSTTGTTHTYSDFIATGVTPAFIPTGTALTATSNPATESQSDLLTATISVPSASLSLIPATGAGSVASGSVTFSAGATPICSSVSLTPSSTPGTYTATCSYETPSSTGPVSLSAVYSGDPYYRPSSGMLSLPVNGSGPVATLSTSSINFGTLYLGSIVTKTVTVSNTGAAAMTISDPRIAIVPGVNGNLSEFITVNLCPKSLAVGKSCTMTVTFIAGPFYNTQKATLSIVDNAPGSPQTVALSATVINPVPQFSATSLNFGTEKVGKATAAKTITVTSVGGTALSITKVAVAGTDPGDYSETNNCITTLNPKASCTISVIFKPTKTGSRPATLVITDNAFNSSQSLLLSGTGD